MDTATLRDMLDGLQVASVLEVECGRGHNLLAFRELLGKKAVLAGVDADPVALKIARETVPDATFATGIALELPFPDSSFDLVFIRGARIQIGDGDFHPDLAEIVRCTRRYVLAIEYDRGITPPPAFLDSARSRALSLILKKSRPWSQPDPDVRPNCLLFEKTSG